MHPLSHDLGDALLARQRHFLVAASSASDVTEQQVRAATISYGDLLDSIGAPTSLAKSIGKYLFELAGWCKAKNLPAINALAVNGSLHRPGPGYYLAPQGEDWDSEVRACLICEVYPQRITG